MLTLPARSPGLDFPTARGPNDIDPAGQSVRVDLGPVKTLAARWREDDPAGGAAPDVRVDQLMWLKLQPGLAQWDVQLKYRISGGSVRRLYIAADPRFSGPESFDLSLAAGSPARSAGAADAGLVDALSVPFGNPPNIGAIAASGDLRKRMMP